MPFFKAIRSGLLAGAAAMFLMCLVAAVIQLFSDISDSTAQFVSIAIIALSVYFSAYFSTQLKRSKGLLQGLICGIAAFLILLIVSVLSGNLSFGDMALKKAAVCIISGAVGGIRGINTKKTKL